MTYLPLRYFVFRLPMLALLGQVSMAQLPVVPDPPTFDDAKVRAVGLRKLVGKHITLYTDLPPGDAIDELPRVFDAAVPSWAKYLGVAPSLVADWRMQGYLMKDREPFKAIGMLPPEREEIREGFSIGRELWLSVQPTDYYRRHLLLHEGTHGFMNTRLGGCGPGWYMEGTAELLGTHRWDGERLELGIMPVSREEVPMLGRIKLVQNAFAENRAAPIAVILRTNNRRPLDNEAYAWCWALAKFLDAHPRYRERFRKLPALVRESDFTDRFLRMYADDWAELVEEWRLFIGTLDHNHDIARTAIDFRPGKPLDAGETHEIAIAADRGWQPSDVRLKTGKTYHITTGGRYVVGVDPRPWPCEPNGVTIEYYGGRPLGMVVGTVYGKVESGKRKAEGKAGSSFLRPFDIGLGTTITAERSGTLYLKINESPGRLGDNGGEVRVELRADPGTDL